MVASLACRSERVSRTKIDGAILKEAKYINLSLHYLEQVIIALHEKAQGRRTHVPYRNSMMTSILRDSLGGNCKTTMIATVAVEQVLVEESIATCRFAQRVALIRNEASINEDVDPTLLIARLKRIINDLRAELALLKGDGCADGNQEVLPDYEKQRIQAAVEQFIRDDENAQLVLSDYQKIQHSFRVFKVTRTFIKQVPFM